MSVEVRTLSFACVLVCCPVLSIKSESDPDCNYQINGKSISPSDSIELKSGENINLWCQIRFWGDWSSTMQWEITPSNVPLGLDVTTDKSESIVKSRLKFSVSDNYSTYVKPSTCVVFRFFCRTNFTEFNRSKENAGKVLKVAPNIRTYNYTWASPAMTICSTGTKVAEFEAKQGNLVIVINPQTAIIVVTCLVAIIIGILVLVILMCKVAMNSGVMQIQKPFVKPTEQGEYCEINETNMDEGRRRVAAKKTNKLGKTPNKPSIEQMEAGVGSTHEGDESEDEVESTLNVRSVNDGISCEDGNQQEDHSEGSPGNILSTESSGKKNTNHYSQLALSTRDELPPPPVFIRMKRMHKK